MQQYKLLVLDLDGTLTNKKKEITPRTRQVLLEAQQRGLRVVLASGRPVYGIAPLADELELAKYGGYVLAYNGGEIIDWSTRKVIYENALDPAVLPLFYRHAQREGFPILTYDGEYVISEDENNEYVAYECMLNKMKHRQIDNFLEVVQQKVTRGEQIPKCLIVGEPERLARLEKEMYDEFHTTNGVFRSEAFFLELVPLGIDKARCLAVLLDELGMTAADMVACGDGYNDKSMIEFAGLGVAMANAKDEVKAVANYITLSNEEDGVAAVVEKFMAG